MNLDLTRSRILIVDDMPDNLDLLCRALENAQYQVQVANSGALALDLAIRSKPDLILLDVLMPKMDGYETCRRLKADAKTQDIPVIFLTALDEVSQIVEGFQAGGVDYMTKPFQKEEALVRIRTHLERAKLATALVEKNQELEALNTQLEVLNAQLEQKVLARTRALNFKVKELEGKDRITQHLLSLHTLENTLTLVLEVIADVLELDKAIIYLKQDNTFQPTAAIGLIEPHVVVSKDQLENLVITSAQTQAMDTIAETQEALLITQTLDGEPPSFALIPILRDNELLGILEVDKHRHQEPLDETEVETLTSFALQAAVAIYDAQIQQNDSRWNQQFEGAFNLDDVLKDSDQLGDLDQK